ncbi:hypothetical protein [Alkalilimnicola ehrlichii]|uniref:DUF7843 domain-containing protein n=1 Tax=Alkalilimnicola ehrlichii TaxID=351052 RepID=A0A3E0WFT0_9GAMM|nr:hypothetical protein [Alkalilimnicola ehrlichii]RFA31802.1 hypothetical protein CAL65_21440 [Alkalilimnicola ehrlichii]
MARRFILALLLLTLSPTSQSHVSEYLLELQAKAQHKQLAHQREWLDLLHYRDRKFLPGQRSDAASQFFFNAADGADNPESELFATLEAFSIRMPNATDSTRSALLLLAFIG